MNNVTKFRGGNTNRAGANASNSEITKRIYLLGVMQAIGPVGENILPRAKKTQAVLAYLCLRRGERLLRGRVAGIIWDRSGEAQARESLRHALNDLNRTGHWRLEKDHDAVRLDVTGCWIDAFEIPEHSELLLESLYGISPSFDQWLVGERIQLEHRWQTRLEKELNGLVAEAAAPELRAAAARCFDRWESLIAARIRADGWPEASVAETASAALALIEGALLLARVSGQVSHLAHAKRAAMSLLGVTPLADEN